ncbi:MAG: hypothetical protein JRE64_15450, partial [Deltaproteobacteria bacterium]|nr:hypothetical protein [Deltaproteobacteria bacterium]
VYKEPTPLEHWVLGFAKAASPKKADVKLRRQAMLPHFENALIMVKKYEAIESGVFGKLLAEHHYWFGRALLQVGDSENAKKALQLGLKTLPLKGGDRDKFYLQLAKAEIDVSGNIDKAQHYLDQVTQVTIVYTVILDTENNS